MDNHKFLQMKYLVSVLSLFLTTIIGCSVAPALESPRIKSGVKLEADGSCMQYEMRWHLSDSVMRGGIYSDELNHFFGYSTVELAPKLKLAFSDRIEFGGYLWCLFLYGGWDGRVKVNILDVGESAVFRNIGLAILAGSKGGVGEWDKSNRNWAGITLGTLQKNGDLEIEYIVMPTIGINHFKSLDDGLGTGGVTFEDVTVNTGAIINLSQSCFVSFAVLVSVHEFDFNYYSHGSSSQIAQIDEIGFTPQKVGFNCSIGWRFGP